MAVERGASSAGLRSLVPGTEALSGLARAFLHAGGRSLLVSNWEVHTKSAVALMTGTFAAPAADPKLSHAQALRRSMLSSYNRKNWDYLIARMAAKLFEDDKRVFVEINV
jgi:CHAT domain-containing protein